MQDKLSMKIEKLKNKISSNNEKINKLNEENQELEKELKDLENQRIIKLCNENKLKYKDLEKFCIKNKERGEKSDCKKD